MKCKTKVCQNEAVDTLKSCQSCREKQNAWTRAWQQKNKEMCAVKHAKWVADNRQHMRDYSNTYNKDRRANDPDFLEQTREWNRASYLKHQTTRKAALRAAYFKDPVAQSHRRHKRRTLIAGCKGTHTLEQWLARIAFYGWCCKYCKRELTQGTVTKDHIIPISKNGTDWASNLAPACAFCNRSKKDHDPKYFMSRGDTK